MVVLQTLNLCFHVKSTFSATQISRKIRIAEKFVIFTLFLTHFFLYSGSGGGRGSGGRGSGSGGAGVAAALQAPGPGIGRGRGVPRESSAIVRTRPAHIQSKRGKKS